MHARLNENLRRSNEELKTAFEDTNVSMVMTDTSHRFLRANAAFARMLGYSREEIVGKTMQDITHPEDVAESLQAGGALDVAQGGRVPGRRAPQAVARGIPGLLLSRPAPGHGDHAR